MEKIPLTEKQQGGEGGGSGDLHETEETFAMCTK